MDNSGAARYFRLATRTVRRFVLVVLIAWTLAALLADFQFADQVRTGPLAFSVAVQRGSLNSPNLIPPAAGSFPRWVTTSLRLRIVFFQTERDARALDPQGSAPRCNGLNFVCPAWIVIIALAVPDLRRVSRYARLRFQQHRHERGFDVLPGSAK